jgi:hypothetical protein
MQTFRVVLEFIIYDIETDSILCERGSEDILPTIYLAGHETIDNQAHFYIKETFDIGKSWLIMKRLGIDDRSINIDSLSIPYLCIMSGKCIRSYCDWVKVDNIQDSVKQKLLLSLGEVNWTRSFT